MSSSAFRPPLRVFALLILVVSSLHWLLLKTEPTRISASVPTPATSAQSFKTRSIVLERPAEPAPLKPAPKLAIKLASKPITKPPTKALAAVPVKAPPQAQPPAVAEIDPAPALEPISASPDESLTAQSPALAATEPDLPAPAASAPAASAAVAAQAPISASSAPSATAALPMPAGPTPTSISAVRLPSSAKLEYKMTGQSKGLNYFADAELNWFASDDQYQASMTVSALFIGSRSMSSAGKINANGLAPTRFADKSRTEVAAHFLAEQGKVSFSANTPDVLWMQGAQDRVSVFLQLAGILAAGAEGKGTRFAPGSSITLYTVGPRDAESWTFNIGQIENQSLPAGNMSTIRLTRLPGRTYDKKVEIWFAPDMDYLPVRSRITQTNGDYVDQQLEKLIRP